MNDSGENWTEIDLKFGWELLFLSILGYRKLYVILLFF